MVSIDFTFKPLKLACSVAAATTASRKPELLRFLEAGFGLAHGPYGAGKGHFTEDRGAVGNDSSGERGEQRRGDGEICGRFAHLEAACDIKVNIVCRR